MNKSVAQLLLALDKASEIYAELNDLAKLKRTYIKAEQLEELDKITNHEMGLVTALYKLEEIRAKLVSYIVSEYSLTSINTITELANQLPPTERRAVLDAKSKLLVGIKAVSEETKFNNKIIEDRLEMIDLTLQALTNRGQDATYSQKEQTQGRKSIFDAKG